MTKVFIMNIKFKALPFYVFILVNTSFLTAAFDTYNPDQINGIKKTFTIDLSNSKVNHFAIKMLHTIYNYWEKFFDESKKLYCVYQDASAVKQYFLMIKDTLQAIEQVFTEDQENLDVQKIANIISAYQDKNISFCKKNDAINLWQKIIILKTPATISFYSLFANILNICITITEENVKTQLQAPDIETSELTKYLEDMKKVASFYEKFEYKSPEAVVLPRAENIPVDPFVFVSAVISTTSLNIKKQQLNAHVLPMINAMITKTDEFIIQLDHDLNH